LDAFVITVSRIAAVVAHTARVFDPELAPERRCQQCQPSVKSCHSAKIA
jgi:hypothetical protein